MNLNPVRKYPSTRLLALALLIGLLVGTEFAQAQSEIEGGCPLASPAEVSEAFEGKISVEIQDADPTGCTFAITGRSYSQVQIVRLSDGGNLVANNRKMLADGEIEGELVDELGEGGVLSLTNQSLIVDLEDGSVLSISISIYMEQLRPVLEDGEKRQGLLTLGRLAVARLAP